MRIHTFIFAVSALFIISCGGSSSDGGSFNAEKSSEADYEKKAVGRNPLDFRKVFLSDRTGNDGARAETDAEKKMIDEHDDGECVAHCGKFKRSQFGNEICVGQIESGHRDVADEHPQSHVKQNFRNRSFGNIFFHIVSDTKSRRS